MRRQQILFSILLTILCTMFFGCEAMADLFHGPKPEKPPVTYTVTFNANRATSGTAPAAMTAKDGSSITLPSGSGLSRTGYAFGGWNTNASGMGNNYNAGTSYTVTKNATLYAKWNTSTGMSYTVTFDANGADSGTAPAAMTADDGSGITLPSGSGLSRSGYTFGGWNTNAAGTGINYAAGSAYTLTGSITLYAFWNNSTETYTVTFNTNGGSGTAPSAQTVSSGSAITLPSGSGLSRTGYTFGGWNTDVSGTGNNYSADVSYTVTGNVTLYAEWDLAYTVTFNTNGGSGTAPSAQTVTTGSSITLPNGDGLSKDGYTFSGWNTQTDGAGTNFGAGASYTVTGNITLYAKWVDAFTVWTVRFETNGSSPVGDATILRNTSVSRPSPDPTRTGYVFEGWFVNAELTTVYNFSSVVTGDITLRAKWNPITYTVAYDKNAADATGSMTNSSHAYDVDKSLNANAFTRTGYTFGGWARTSSGIVEFANSVNVINLTATAGATVTLYAKWNPITYTVTFNINSGSGTAPSVQLVSSGSVITLPSDSGLSRAGYIFGGWNANASGTGTNYSAGSSYTVTSNVTLYAKWELITNVLGSTLVAKLSWLQRNAQSGVDYTVEVNADESIAPQSLSYSGKTNIGITLKGMGAVRTVSLSSNGALFTVGNGVTLVLDNNITLQGRSDNTDSLVKVINRGTLVMNTGSVVTGNTSSGNGGGVFVNTYGTFTMSSGKISGNTATGGGGAYVSGGTFTMNGGEISDNTASNYGGGVVMFGGTFTMSGGKISDNTAIPDGGGVYVIYDVIFTMTGGEISGNTASSGGGGVCVTSGTFTMSGGEIFGNTATERGGGVSLYSTDTTFTKTGGTIYGYSASDTVNSNVVKDISGAVQSNRGHAVYVNSSPVKRRETTAEPSVNMDSSADGTAGGWDN